MPFGWSWGRSALAAAGVVGAWSAGRRLLASWTWPGKVVLVTGGTRGLGLILARHLVRLGARVAILARDAGELRAAEDELRGLGGDVIAVRCDVGDVYEALTAVNETVRRLGRLDVVINNAGIIQVGPLDTFSLEDFRATMQANFWGAVHVTLSALPHLRRVRGRLVNVSSIGGEVAVPHLLPYTSSKFALAGFSEGLHAELAADGVGVTTVIPGLMRTGSFVNALFKGRREDEMTWFTLGSTLPGVSIDADRAARRILLACARGEAHVVVGAPAKVLRLASALAPGLVARAMALVNRMLPKAGGAGPRDDAEPGYLWREGLARSWITRLGDRAARRNREIPWAPPKPA